MKTAVKKIATRLLIRAGGGGPVSDRVGGEGRAHDYFIRPGYQPRPMPKYFDDFGPGEDPRVYQPDIYTLADSLASLGSSKVVDIGCGKALKLCAFAGRHEIVGVDYGPNIEYCRAQHAFGQWLTHDLESDEDLPLAGLDLDRAVVVCSDVIEHLVNPLALLRKLKACADRGA